MHRVSVSRLNVIQTTVFIRGVLRGVRRDASRLYMKKTSKSSVQARENQFHNVFLSPPLVPKPLVWACCF
jgi:hypothetical protein